MRKIRVAVVQVESQDGQPQRNLAHATPFVEQAVDQGAELVLCPEFLAAGYIYDESIWEAGETVGGPTETWLSELARRLGIHIGASYLEAEGSDFYNTFTLPSRADSVALPWLLHHL